MMKKKGKDQPPLTAHIELVARGVSDDWKRFVMLKVQGDAGEKEVLVRETRVKEFADPLEKAGASIISLSAQRSLEERLQAFSSTPPTFKVATRIELREEAMALPGGPHPKTAAFRVCLVDVPSELQAKFMVAGTLKGWRKITKLARGNSRFILALCLQFVGPLSFVIPVPHVGFQLLGKGGEGTSSLLASVSSVWGWDPDEQVANEMGFGTTWNATANAIERIAAAYNQTCLNLNETGNAEGKGRAFAEALLSVLMKISGAVGKARLTEEDSRRWYVPLLSTSNISVAALARAAGKEQVAPYIDRLADIPAPAETLGMFETLHGYSDLAAFCVAIKDIAAANHGVAGRRFIKKLYAETAQSKKALSEWLSRRIAFYLKRAKKRIKSRSRDLTRVHGRFAVAYAAGRLAARFGILPYNQDEIMRAMLQCEQDHVEFVDRELAGQTSGGSAVERLRTFLRSSRATFVDLRTTSCDQATAKAAPGFIGKHGKGPEFWLRNDAFETWAGGPTPADALKVELHRTGMLSSESVKGKPRTVVRRAVPHAKNKREWMVAIPIEFVEGG